ncbi:MAG: VOC family protein, partial [Candidatus Nitrosocosmicus sp.]|nr:VOC family protein [Candidatus Nitrosocosmicus sp.]
MNDFVYFEIPVNDFDKSKKFYNDIFDWNIQTFRQTGENNSFTDFHLININDETGKVSLMGRLIQKEKSDDVVINYIQVNSIDEYLKKIVSLGGSIIVSKKDIPGKGYYAIFEDTENNRFGLW